MQSEPNRMTPQEQTDLAENCVLHLMLDDDTPGLWTTEELVRAHGNPVSVIDALAGLHAMGLVHRHDELVWPTRAAVRATQIEDAF